MDRPPTPLRLLAAATAGYLVGTLPSADLAARLATQGRLDIRAAGTRNPGAANAMAVLGRRWGLAVMAADIVKGMVAARAGRVVAGDRGAHVAATAAVTGHCYPVWSGFRGGKGVATSVGQVLATFPAYFPVDLTVAYAVHSRRGWRNRAFAATTASSAAWIAAATLWWRRRWPNLWGPEPSPALPLAAVASAAVIARRFADEEARSRSEQEAAVLRQQLLGFDEPEAEELTG